MKIFLFALILSALPVSAIGSTKVMEYRVAETPWAEELGSQRVVIHSPKRSILASVEIPWRRHDKNVAAHKFIIVDAETGAPVTSIYRGLVTAETCSFSFGPTKKDRTYYFYYLPYEPQKSHGWYQKDYLPADPPHRIKPAVFPDPAEVLCIEARTPHDSFFPMEVIATRQEIADFKKAFPKSYYVFLEDRRNPVKMRNNVPVKWLRGDTADGSVPAVRKNEYFTFQVAVWAGTENLDDVKVEWTDFTGESGKIPAQKITCINTEGINPRGEHFTKRVDVPAGGVQAFWMGVDVAADQASGEYAGTITITPQGKSPTHVPVKFCVTDEFVEDRGDSVPADMTRLRWLNSTLGISDEPIAPYSAIKRIGNDTFEVLGRKIKFSKTSPCPWKIEANGDELLTGSPISFYGNAFGEFVMSDEKLTAGALERSYVGKENDSIKSTAKMRMEFDGWMKFSFTLEAKKDAVKTDAHLKFNFNPTNLLFMGFGRAGGALPKNYSATWQGNSSGEKFIKPFDSFWTGNANVGVHCEFLGANYHGPLLNLYRPAPPEPWSNQGKGKLELAEATHLTIREYDGQMSGKFSRAQYSTGEIELKKGVPVTFEFALLPTPVKPLDSPAQFKNRYYHSGGRPRPSEQDFKDGVRVVNVHHANNLNPIINYPFITVPAFKEFAADCHAKGAKVKIYYTVRELTTALPELWALRSLGHEIFAAGKGGNGFPWLREHLVDDYYTQWYAPLNGEFDQYVVADAALLTAPGESRWLNYYVEGLRWLCKNADIDGIYMDDVSFDRHMLKRMRRAMAAGGKPDGLIDLHSNTGFSIGPAIQYTDFFPYVDKIWFGESFRYDEMSPENWLVECSGIPFGLMGDTLQNGGNPWLSMQYGMSARHPWSGAKSEKDPRNLWKLWDAFGIADSKMIGWWNSNCPVKISGKNPEAVKATVYLKPKSALISVGNYSKNTEEFSLKFDWEKLGINKERAVLRAAEIPNMQQAETFPLDKKFSIPAKRGILLILEEK